MSLDFERIPAPVGRAIHTIVLHDKDGAVIERITLGPNDWRVFAGDNLGIFQRSLDETAC